jgi:hypothetical protein
MSWSWAAAPPTLAKAPRIELTPVAEHQDADQAPF